MLSIFQTWALANGSDNYDGKRAVWTRTPAHYVLKLNRVLLLSIQLGSIIRTSQFETRLVLVGYRYNMLYLWFSRTGGYIHMLVVYCMRSRLRSRHSVTTSVEDHDIWRPDRSDRRTSDNIETHGFHSKCCAYGSV